MAPYGVYIYHAYRSLTLYHLLEIDMPKDMEENADDDEEETSPEAAGNKKKYF